MENPSKYVVENLFGTGISIHWYGVLIVIGVILSIILATKEAKRKKLYKDAVIDLALYVIPLGIIGARLYYVIFEFSQYKNDLLSIFRIWEGGLAIYGAIIGGFIGMLIFSKRKKIRFFKLADIVIPGLVLAQAIGRWGNFFNQEAFGLPVTNEALMWFPMTVRIDGIHYFNGAACSNPYHLATFFYESLWCLLVFIFLWSTRKKYKHDGDVMFIYFMLYGFERMLVEPLRGDSLWLIKDVIRVSQLVSLLLFVGILIFLIIRRSKEKKLGYSIWPKDEVLGVFVDDSDEPLIKIEGKTKLVREPKNINKVEDEEEN